MKKDKNEILDEVLKLEGECGSIIDAVVTICEKYDIEVETVASYIRQSKDMKERVSKEGTNLRLLK